MDQNKKIEWFLNFLNLDFKTLGIGDRMKWEVDSMNMVDHGTVDDGSPRIVLADSLPPGRWNDFSSFDTTRFEAWREKGLIKICQDRLKDFMSNVMNQIQEIQGKADSWNDWGKSIPGYFGLFQDSFEVKIRLETGRLPDLEFKKDDNEKLLWKYNAGAIDSLPLLFNIKAMNEEDTLLLQFLRALAGVKFGDLRTCPECGKYFIHIAKRVRTFCSNKCASRLANRDARKKIKDTDPEKYQTLLKEGAERSGKSYRNKIKKQLGVQVKINNKQKRKG